MSYSHGIENLHTVHHILDGKRLGLITNPSAVDSRLHSTLDILASQYQVVRLFAPEHGVRGDKQAGVVIANEIDEKTKIPVESLYGSSHGGTLNTEGLDAVVYDIQDVGVRFYTYTYTMANAMKACAKANIPFIVLDRYNPLGLLKVEGCLMDSRFDSGVGAYGLPTRHGMTIGELARYFNKEFHIHCALTVVPCQGLERHMDFRHVNVAWVLPSPNCATYDTAVCYAGTVLFEGTNVSEGRGTVRPFELIGAPWMNSEQVMEELEKKELPGVLFRPAYFRPTFSKFKDEQCQGLQIHVTDPDVFPAVRCGILLVDTIRKLHPEFSFRGKNDWYFVDQLMGTDALRRENFDTDTFLRDQVPSLSAFKEKVKPYLLYR